MGVNPVPFIFLPKVIRCSIVNLITKRVGVKMMHLRCNNCHGIITDKMDSYYHGNIGEFFCSHDCMTEYCIREREIQKVDVKNVRQLCDIALFKNGELYQSNIEDDSCPNCESGTYRFLEMIIENDMNYEIYKCNRCGDLLKIKCD